MLERRHRSVCVCSVPVSPWHPEGSEWYSRSQAHPGAASSALLPTLRSDRHLQARGLVLPLPFSWGRHTQGPPELAATRFRVESAVGAALARLSQCPPEIHAADRNPRPVATGVGAASWPGGRGRSKPVPHSLTEHLLCPGPRARPGRESVKRAPVRSGFLFSLALEGRTVWVAFFFFPAATANLLS